MEDVNIQEINERVKQESEFIHPLKIEMGKVIVGQSYLIERLLIGLLADGHVLLEGVPGLAKTLCIRTLSQCLSADFQRIQFTPDLLPADIIGTLIYNPKSGEFNIKKGPVFTNILLADEINRAPAKVQSALLEAMQEKQVTIGEETFTLDKPFLVLATQNPVEQEGTYPLPEAQVDRFMLKVSVSYSNMKEEKEILKRMSKLGEVPEASPVVTPEQILNARKIVNSIYMDEKVEDYILNLVFASREPEAFNLDIKDLIQLGASPRATICLARAAKAYAFMNGRGYVTPQDVKEVAPDILRHRIMISFEAEAEEISQDIIVGRLLDEIKVP